MRNLIFAIVVIVAIIVGYYLGNGNFYLVFAMGLILVFCLIMQEEINSLNQKLKQAYERIAEYEKRDKAKLGEFISWP